MNETRETSDAGAREDPALKQSDAGALDADARDVTAALAVQDAIGGPGTVAVRAERTRLRVTAVVYEDAKEGGFWAEVPALPGCYTEADTYEELLANIREAVAGYLDVLPGNYEPGEGGRGVEVEL